MTLQQTGFCAAKEQTSCAGALPLSAYVTLTLCAECLEAALWPLSAGAFWELNAAKESFWFIASPVSPHRVSREFLSAANDMKINRHENILGTPASSNM